MNIVLLQARASVEEIDLLFREFPQYLFLGMNDFSYKNLGPDQWARVEILFGNHLNANELALAPELRWIQSPSPNLSALCLPEIQRRENIIVTDTPAENTHQVAEFAISAILCFAKNMFHWRDANEFPALLWDSKWRDTMWTLTRKLLVQVGMGNLGLEIAQHARELGMRIWAVDDRQTFHQNCDKSFSYKELHSILPVADVVCVALPRSMQMEEWFGEVELDLMKEDSILIVLGNDQLVDGAALTRFCMDGKFRGVLIDALHQKPISSLSPLWKAPQLIITPDVASRPKGGERKSFHAFMVNLRKYVNGNYNEMNNRILDLLAHI